MRLPLCAVLLALAGCASAPERAPGRVMVDAEGWAVEKPGDPSGSRVAALADAQKRAVEKAAGVSVAAATRVDGGVATRQRIWSESRGRVEAWSLLADRAEDGFRKIRIRAAVRLGGPEDAAAAPPPEDAKLRVEGGGSAAPGIRRALAARGFTVVDKGGDFVVDARTAARLLRDGRMAPFVSGRARVALTVKDPSGAVVWESAREASSLDADPLLAAARAGEAAGELAGRDAAEGLAEALWRR